MSEILTFEEEILDLIRRGVTKASDIAHQVTDPFRAHRVPEKLRVMRRRGLIRYAGQRRGWEVQS